MMEDNKDPDVRTEGPGLWLASLVGGACAGVAVDISLFPLDTLKTRLQSQHGFWKSGGFSRIYAGIGPAAAGSAPNAALFFVTYDVIKKKLGSENDARVHMVAASCGEVTACLVRVPVEIVKQRRQASADLGNVSNIIRKTLRTEGPMGFYRGYFTTVIREIPFSLIQFPIWEKLKKKWTEHQQGQPIAPWQSATCGSIAGGISAGLTTPLDVAKTRIMLAPAGSETRTLPVIRNVFVEQGIRGVFSGIVPRVMWISIGGFVFFGVYEKAKSLIS